MVKGGWVVVVVRVVVVGGVVVVVVLVVVVVGVVVVVVVVVGRVLVVVVVVDPVVVDTGQGSDPVTVNTPEHVHPPMDGGMRSWTVLHGPGGIITVRDAVVVVVVGTVVVVVVGLVVVVVVRPVVVVLRARMRQVSQTGGPAPTQQTTNNSRSGSGHANSGGEGEDVVGLISITRCGAD